MRNLNRVCNEEIEEPTGQETIREREKKYKKERTCALSSRWDQPINREKKEHALEGKRNRNLRKQASGLDSVPYIDRCRLSFPSSRWSLRQKGKLLFIIILLGIEFYSFFPIWIWIRNWVFTILTSSWKASLVGLYGKKENCCL